MRLALAALAIAGVAAFLYSKKRGDGKEKGPITKSNVAESDALSPGGEAPAA